MSNRTDFLAQQGVIQDALTMTPAMYKDGYKKFPVASIDLFSKLEQTLILAGLSWQSFLLSGFLLQGANGSGKSLWGSVLVKKALENAVNARVVNHSGLLDYYFEEHKFPIDTGIADLLVIDEVGKEIQKNAGYLPFIRLLDYRQSVGKKTVLITNLSVTALTNMYGQTITSRLNDFVPVYFPTFDIREYKRLQKNSIQNDGKKEEIQQELL